jgi:hypothetical protein
MTDQYTEASEQQPLIDRRERYAQIQDEENGPTAVNELNTPSQEQAQDEHSRLAVIQALPWYKRPSIAWLLPFLFLVALVLGISQAPQEQLIIRIICKSHLKDKETRSEGDTVLMMRALLGDDPSDPCRSQDILALAAIVLGRVRALKYIAGMDQHKRGRVILGDQHFHDAHKS